MARAVLCLLTAALLPRAALAAPVPSATGELFAGGGYDTDVLYDVAVDPSLPGYQQVSDGFAVIGPRLVGTLTLSGFRIDLQYEADVRATIANGVFGLQEVSLSLRSPELYRVRVHGGGSGARFDASRFDAGRYLAASGHAGLAVRISDDLRLMSEYRLTLRDYPDPARAASGSQERDLSHSGALRLGFVPGPRWEIGAAGGVVAIRSDLAGVAVDRWRGALDGRLHPRDRITLSTSGWLGIQRSPSTGSDIQLGAEAGIRIRALAHLDVVASYGALVELSCDTQCDTTRHLVSVGVLVHATTRASRGNVASGGTAVVEPEVRGTRVRFRLRAPGAAAVTVMGSWNDWAEQSLTRGDSDVWETWADVGSGSHRYRFVVDGRPVRPADAARHMPDGFGGQDGVLDVP